SLVLPVLGLALLPSVTRWDRLLLAWVMLQMLAYGAYWHDGTFLGPRFLYTVAPVFVVYAARGARAVIERSSGGWRQAAVALVPACVVIPFLMGSPQAGLMNGVLGFETRHAYTRGDFADM